MAHALPSRFSAVEAKYTHNGFVVLRTPLLPFDVFREWSALIESAPPSGADELSERVERDRVRLTSYVRDSYRSPLLREALLLASPELCELLDDNADRGVKADTRVNLALARYLARATYRATPFGLFAGCSLVAVKSTSRLTIAARDAYTAHTRLDMHYVTDLAAEATRDPATRFAMRAYPNNSLHLVADQLHYVVAAYKNGRRQYSLDSVEQTDAIASTLALASRGATLDELAVALVDEGVSKSEATEFVDALVDMNLLVLGVEPLITGGDAARTLSEDLATAGAHTAAATLRDACNVLYEHDVNPLGSSTDAYRSCENMLRLLPAPLKPGKTFQVDLFKPSPDAGIAAPILAEAAQATELLLRIALAPDVLADFRDRFRERYEEREVPLLEALDDEIGIGLESRNRPNLNAHDFAERSRIREAYLAEIARRSDGQPVELTDSDIDRLASHPRVTPRPDSVALVATVIANGSPASDIDDFQLSVGGVVGPSGANWLGRFSHLDGALLENVRSHIRAEERLSPHAIFAEVVHLPQGRVGNVISRPVLREHELCYLGRGGTSQAAQINARDLTVSVQGSRLRLWSTLRNCEVIPRLTSAHNYTDSSNLPIYRFLCLMQRHDVTPCMPWSWGQHETVASFLPRITRGRLILARARWLVRSTDLGVLTKSVGAARLLEAQRLRHKRGIPRHVAIVEGDNHLPLDLGNL